MSSEKVASAYLSLCRWFRLLLGLLLRASWPLLLSLLRRAALLLRTWLSRLALLLLGVLRRRRRLLLALRPNLLALRRRRASLLLLALLAGASLLSHKRPKLCLQLFYLLRLCRLLLFCDGQNLKQSIEFLLRLFECVFNSFEFAAQLVALLFKTLNLLLELFNQLLLLRVCAGGATS